jgi:hypothetical protein
MTGSRVKHVPSASKQTVYVIVLCLYGIVELQDELQDEALCRSHR